MKHPHTFPAIIVKIEEASAGFAAAIEAGHLTDCWHAQMKLCQIRNVAAGFYSGLICAGSMHTAKKFWDEAQRAERDNMADQEAVKRYQSWRDHVAVEFLHVHDHTLNRPHCVQDYDAAI